MPLEVTAKIPTSKLEVGSYNVLCTGVYEAEIADSPFNPEVYRFALDVENTLDEDGNPATTDSICSRTLSPKSKLWSYLVAFGLTPEVGRVIDIEGVIGKRAMAVVTKPEKGDFNRVTNIVPLPKGVKNAPTQHVPNGKPLAEAGIDALTEAQALAAWFDAVKAHGYTPKEIGDHSMAKYQRQVSQLTASEREELALELQP